MVGKNIFDVEAPYSTNTLVLSQFNGCSTEPYTIFVSRVLCKPFKISTKGARSISQALNNLPCYQTPDAKLTFGWALDGLIRNRKVHDNDYEHLATMICLCEIYYEVYAAQVMFEMAQQMAGPDDITPHFSQWKDLLHSVSGGFACTDFGVVLEDYVRLDPYNVQLSVLRDQAGAPPVKAAVVAEALRALAKITTGEEQHLTVIGSAGISFLAALADWVYDLSIAVFSATGKQLHVSHPGQEAQMTFVFQETIGVHISNEPWIPDHTQSPDVKQDDQLSYGSSVHWTIFSGRVVWQSVLPRVFGQSFHHLDHEMSRDLATFLGAGARMFQGLAQNQDYADLLSASNRANDQSYGIGLIQTYSNWLPELRRVQGRMERQLKVTGDEASKTYVDTMATIRKACNCGICALRPPETPPPPMPSHLDEVTPKPKYGYCLITLCETIIALGLALSRIAVTSNLYPSRAGMQSFYHSQAMRRLTARGKHWKEHFQIVFGREWNAPDSKRLVNVIQIFSGTRPRKWLPEGLVALSHEGICAYFMGLEKRDGMRRPTVVAGMDGLDLKEGPKGGVRTGADTGGVKLIRIVSGGINVRYKVFERAALGEVTEEGDEGPWERVVVDHLEEPLSCR